MNEKTLNKITKVIKKLSGINSIDNLTFKAKGVMDEVIELLDGIIQPPIETVEENFSYSKLLWDLRKQCLILDHQILLDLMFNKRSKCPDMSEFEMEIESFIYDITNNLTHLQLMVLADENSEFGRLNSDNIEGGNIFTAIQENVYDQLKVDIVKEYKQLRGE